MKWVWPFNKKTVLPDEVDWRDEGVVTPVKHQGSCGSCWAFTDAGVLESNFAIASGKKGLEISEQQILDCVNNKNFWIYHSMQCDGGYPHEGLDFAK